MPQISYIGADGKTYTYDLPDIDLTKIDLSGVSNSIDNNSFIDWTNPNFEVPVQIGNLGGDPLYNLTANSLTYLQNMMKSGTEQDYNRWKKLFDDQVNGVLVYEIGELKKLVERYNKDYGQPSPDISGKLQTLVEVTNKTNQLISGFSSMAGVSSVLAGLSAAILPLAIITTVFAVLDNVMLTTSQPARQKQVIDQADKVQKMVEAFAKAEFVEPLRKFDKPITKPNQQSEDRTPYYIAGGILLYMIFIAILKKIKSQ